MKEWREGRYGLGSMRVEALSWAFVSLFWRRGWIYRSNLVALLSRKSNEDSVAFIP